MHTQAPAAVPKGLNSNNDVLSVFLDSPEAAWVPDHLNPTAKFKLYLINQAKTAEDYVKGGSLCSAVLCSAVQCCAVHVICSLHTLMPSMSHC